ncbi:DUF3024 domain-containing protein [Kribbella jiaozuonensis]|uniref:DUF3024 domain-containing protein n=1 Tax=Kribbella jiaozuonensis TaxID=2575441 RepID=UPI00192D1F19|nr:DUF3024 domain-containing protein [Kribbella jiaozuonensis]
MYGYGAPHESRARPQPTAHRSELAARRLTIVERRRSRREDLGPDLTSCATGRLHYNATPKSWMLYWADQQLFHAYARLSPSQSIDDLLTEIDRDPTNIFRG